MKQIALILAQIALTIFSVSAQFINSLQVFPANPTTNDNISLVANLTFSSGTCNSKELNHYVYLNQINANAIHCIGPLTYICYDSDTFNIGNLNAGNYTFYFQVDAGIAPSPCTPGIVAGPIDSLQFSVSLATGLKQLNNDDITIGPNPTSSMLNINFKSSGNILKTIGVFSLDGRLIKEVKTTREVENISLDELQLGMYLLRIELDNFQPYNSTFIKQ